MRYIFYYDSFGKHKRVVEAGSFREARNVFFEMVKTLKYMHLDAIHECDDEGNYLRNIKF